MPSISQPVNAGIKIPTRLTADLLPFSPLPTYSSRLSSHRHQPKSTSLFYILSLLLPIHTISLPFLKTPLHKAPEPSSIGSQCLQYQLLSKVFKLCPLKQHTSPFLHKVYPKAPLSFFDSHSGSRTNVKTVCLRDPLLSRALFK